MVFSTFIISLSIFQFLKSNIQYIFHLCNKRKSILTNGFLKTEDETDEESKRQKFVNEVGYRGTGRGRFCN